MASLQKIVYIRYVDRDGRRVPRGTKGARKVKEESAKWYACWKEGKKQVRIPLATDKEASQAMLADLLRNKARGKAGLVDPFQPHLQRLIGEHVTEYLASVKATCRSQKHYDETERILNVVIKACGVQVLADLTADKMARYLAAKSGSARTKNMHRTIVHAFCNWLANQDPPRLDRNPIEKVARYKGEKKRKRRALRAEELQRLLHVVRERPLKDAQTNKGGRLPKGLKREYKADLRPEVQEQLRQLGRERGLIYKAAMLTGLRKSELAALKVAFLHLDHKPYPYLELPGEYTKNTKPAKLLLVPSFAEELRQWISDTGRSNGDTLFAVPDDLCEILRRDLKAAGIPYKDEQERYADFHSLRHSANTMLGLAGVPAKVRQQFMRHADIKLTLEVYDDASLYELEQAVKAMEKLNLQ